MILFPFNIIQPNQFLFLLTLFVRVYNFFIIFFWLLNQINFDFLMIHLLILFLFYEIYFYLVNIQPFLLLSIFRYFFLIVLRVN